MGESGREPERAGPIQRPRETLVLLIILLAAAIERVRGLLERLSALHERGVRELTEWVAKQNEDDQRRRQDDAKRKKEEMRAQDTARRPGADDYLSARAHFTAWTAFAEGHEWSLDREKGRVSGRYRGHRATVSFPPTYLGGTTHVRLHARRRLPSCHVRSSRWWELGKAPVMVLMGEAHLPAELVAFLERHRIELETAQQQVRCTLPRCDVDLVRDLMDHLVSFAAAPASYRRPALAG